MADTATRKLSASDVWDATAAFLRKHGSLAVTLALAFSALPQILAYPVLGDLSTLGAQPGQPPSAEQVVRLLPAMLLFIVIGLIGSLAIFSLVLKPGLSVGEAIARGVRRLPAAVLQIILFALLGSLIALPLGVAAGLGAAGGGAGAAIGLLALLFIPVLVYIFLRIFLGQVAVADGLGPVAGIRRSWDITRGNVLRIFGLLIVVGIVFVVVYFASTFILGSLATLLGNAVGGEGTGRFLALVVSALVSAVLSAVTSVLYAQIYRHLTGPDYAETFA